MSWLLFAEKQVRELSVVPQEHEPIFGYSERLLILKAVDTLARDTYNLTFGAIGEGPMSIVEVGEMIESRNTEYAQRRAS